MVRSAPVIALAALMCGAGALPLRAEGPDQLVETYRDWVMRCVQAQPQDAAPAGRVCEMTQELSHTDSGQRVLVAAVQATGTGTAALTLIAPFGLRLGEGIVIRVGGQDMATIPFRTCLPQGCIADMELDGAALDQLRMGAEGQVVMVTDGGQDLSLTVSLAGFSAAWSRLGALLPEN